MMCTENNQSQRQHKLSAKLRKLKFAAIIALALLSLGASAQDGFDPSTVAAVKNAATQGKVKAQSILGIMYENGYGVSQDFKQALYWSQKAADQGDPTAQFLLGFLYDKGQGVSQDCTQAASWYRKSADQGNSDAQFRLSVLYAKGQGIEQDYAQALYWSQKSANNGNADGQVMLGVSYETGIGGVAQNSIISYALYNLAASGSQSSNNLATSHRQSISRKMTLSQVEEGQSLTRRMKSKGVLKAIDYETNHNPSSNQRKTEPLSKQDSPNNMWPARPAKTQGQTSCNTRCINGSCWRTYDNGQHVHLNVPPSMDPFSGEMTFNTPPC